MAIGVDGMDGVNVRKEVTPKHFVLDLNLGSYSTILVLTQLKFNATIFLVTKQGNITCFAIMSNLNSY